MRPSSSASCAAIPLPPRTSQPPPGDFRRLFDFLLSHHDEVVYVGLSRAVSGTLQTGERGRAQRRRARARGGHAQCLLRPGLLAERAAELAQQGLTLPPSRGASRRWYRARTSTPTFATSPTWCVAGAFPPWTLPITRWLGLVPVARMGSDGRLHAARVLRARADLPERFARWLAARVDARQPWRVLVGHADAADEGERLCVALQRLLPQGPPPRLVEAGAAISAHSGPGVLVVSLMPDE